MDHPPSRSALLIIILVTITCLVTGFKDTRRQQEDPRELLGVKETEIGEASSGLSERVVRHLGNFPIAQGPSEARGGARRKSRRVQVFRHLCLGTVSLGRTGELTTIRSFKEQTTGR